MRFRYVNKGVSHLVVNVETRPHADAAGRYRWSREYLEELPSDVLHLSDPTLTPYPDLEAGWGIGTFNETVEQAFQIGLKDIFEQRDRATVIIGSGATAGCALKLPSILATNHLILFDPFVAWYTLRPRLAQQLIATTFSSDWQKAAPRANVTPYLDPRTLVTAHINPQNPIEHHANFAELYRMTEQARGNNGSIYSNVRVEARTTTEGTSFMSRSNVLAAVQNAFKELER